MAAPSRRASRSVRSSSAALFAAFEKKACHWASCCLLLPLPLPFSNAARSMAYGLLEAAPRARARP
eukprot:2954743-Heterocapsa_arctica.AAC.1